MKRFNFQSAIAAGFIATVVMTIFMAFFDMNIMKMLGVAMGKTGGMAYVFGGIVHLIIGLIYGLIYGLIIQPIFSGLPGFISGLIYGVIIFVIALIFTPTFMKTLHSWSGEHPKTKMSAASYHTAYHCGPCQMQQYGQDQAQQYQQYGQDQADQYRQGTQPGQQQYDQYGRPVQPGQQQYDQYGRPVQPNQQQHDQYGRPVQPNQQQHDQYGRPVQPNQQQYDQYGRPVQPDHSMQQKSYGYNQQSHPCAKHPCAHKKGGLPAWLWVLFNHLVYGFVLGIFYRPRKTDDNPQGQ